MWRHAISQRVICPSSDKTHSPHQNRSVFFRWARQGDVRLWKWTISDKSMVVQGARWLCVVWMKLSWKRVKGLGFFHRWCRSSKQKHAPRPSNNLLKGCKLVLSCTHDVCKKSLFLWLLYTYSSITCCNSDVNCLFWLGICRYTLPSVIVPTILDQGTKCS